MFLFVTEIPVAAAVVDRSLLARLGTLLHGGGSSTGCDGHGRCRGARDGSGGDGGGGNGDGSKCVTQVLFFLP